MPPSRSRNRPDLHGSGQEEPASSEDSHGTKVPRSLQSTVGLLTATTVAGVTLGGLIGVISALALGRFGRLGVRGVSLSVAAIGFVCISLVPFVAYPPNPPAVGDPNTIDTRSALFFIMLAISIIAAATAVLVKARWQVDGAPGTQC